MSTLKVNTLIEATAGGATFYTAKAWVNFNGDGAVSIRGSGNVTSISDVGTGAYTVNLTSALSNSNYCANASLSETDINAGQVVMVQPVSSSSCRLQCDNLSGAADDMTYVFCNFFSS